MNKFSVSGRPCACRIAAALGVVALLCSAPAKGQQGGTLTLQEAIRLALQNSPEMKLAQVQYNVALGQANLDRAAFRPNLYTGTGLAYTHGFPSLPGGQAPSVFELDYQQTIFNPLLKGQQHAAEDRAKNQKIEMDRMRDNIIVRTATAFLNLAGVRHSLDLMSTEQDSSQKILQIVQERLKASLALPVDLTRAQLTLAQIHERTVKLEDSAEALEGELRNLTGIPESQPISVSAEEPSFANAPAAEGSESDVINLAVENDRTVQEAENERAAREQELHGAKLSYFPSVALVGQYSVLSKFNNYNEFYKKFERNNVNVGVQVTIPLFAAKTSATVALAKSQLNAADLEVGQRRREVSREIRQKIQSVRELEASREVARLELQLAQQNLQIEQSKFNDGRATLQEMEQARLDESDKWVAFLDADFAREQAQLVLLQATGQLAKVFQ